MALSQTREILEHLKTGSTVTSMFCFAKFGITRMSARLQEIQKAGVTVESRWVKCGQKSYKEYYLPKKKRK